MTAGDEYRRRSAEINAAAKLAPTPRKRLELEHLARSYLRLAEQADRNIKNDITYGEMLPRRDDGPNRKKGSQP